MAKQFLCSLDAPIVETVSGKVRGFQVDGTYTFHGIPYAKAKRFQMPEPFPSWKDRGVPQDIQAMIDSYNYHVAKFRKVFPIIGNLLNR